MRKLILKAIETKTCVICDSKFDFKNIRYYCESCTRFLCIRCSTSQWVFESVESEERERPVCRCKNCLATIKQHEDALTTALATMDFHTVDKVYSEIMRKNIDIDVKLLHQAAVTHLKLEKELDIRNFMKSVEHVDDYKTILKSVKIINDKLEHAKGLNVELDPTCISEINKCTSRLISERNLRHQMESLEVHTSEHEHVDQLKNLLEQAHEHGVHTAYKEDAEKLS